MDMNLLKYMAFLKTVDCGSFTKASEVLNYSQSGISRMIRDLERELHKDELLVVLPEDHPLVNCDRFPVEALCDYPIILFEKNAKAETAEIFENNNLVPRVIYTTWDDYAIMAMVERGLGISILPELILKRIPYHIVAKKLSVPAYRTIGLALRSQKTVSLAVKRFLEYLPFRDS